VVGAAAAACCCRAMRLSMWYARVNSERMCAHDSVNTERPMLLIGGTAYTAVGEVPALSAQFSSGNAKAGSMIQSTLCSVRFSEGCWKMCAERRRNRPVRTQIAYLSAVKMVGRPGWPVPLPSG
jgi:hypothetical protein